MDENGDRIITVFEMNQSTKHMDPTLNYRQVIDLLCGQTTLKMYPAITEEDKKQIVSLNFIRTFLRRKILKSNIYCVKCYRFGAKIRIMNLYTS